MEPFERYHYYSQNLLLAQHEVSEIIEHSLTRGEVREDFIIQFLTRTITDCQNYLKRGFINLGKGEQSGQADILLVKKFSEKIELGSSGTLTINPDDCIMAIEVKSTLTGTYLKEFNIEAKRIKTANADIVCGMFASKSDLEKKTIMHRFGFYYDDDTKTYFTSKKVPLPVQYPYIDFILLLDKIEVNEIEGDLEFQGKNQLFLRKASDAEKYYPGVDIPVIRNLVSLVRSLLIGRTH